MSQIPKATPEFSERARRYPAEVFWSDEDDGFIARAPDLPGCSAWAASEAEAIDELRTAIDAWISASAAAGNSIPEPSAPSSASKYSGKFLVRLPKRLHAELAQAAQAEGVSLNQYVLYLLASRSVPQAVRTSDPLPGRSLLMEQFGQLFRAEIQGVTVTAAADEVTKSTESVGTSSSARTSRLQVIR